MGEKRHFTQGILSGFVTTANSLISAFPLVFYKEEGNVSRHLLMVDKHVTLEGGVPTSMMWIRSGLTLHISYASCYVAYTSGSPDFFQAPGGPFELCVLGIFSMAPVSRYGGESESTL